MRIKKTYHSFLMNEAKIHISDDLSQTLDLISANTPESEINWAERMKSLIGNEVETNINYLTTSDNPDMVKWRPDEKANSTYFIWMPQRYYRDATAAISGRIPEGAVTGRVLRKLTTTEAARLLKGNMEDLQKAQFEYLSLIHI